MSWVWLMLAGLGEAFGVLGMNLIKTRRLIGYLTMILGFAVSFGLLILAMQQIPLSTAYAVWTGIGSVGGALIGMFWFHESHSWLRIFFIGLIIAAVVGLKLV